MLTWKIEWEPDLAPDFFYLGKFTDREPAEGWYTDRREGLVLDAKVFHDEFLFDDPLDTEDRGKWFAENRYIAPIHILEVEEYVEDEGVWYDVYYQTLIGEVATPGYGRNSMRYAVLNADWCDYDPDSVLRDAQRLENLGVFWWYEGCIVSLCFNGMELGSASLWGIESDCDDYKLEVESELKEEALEQARQYLPTLRDRIISITLPDSVEDIGDGS